VREDHDAAGLLRHRDVGFQEHARDRDPQRMCDGHKDTPSQA
jgi:hypothetical protein